MNKRNSDSPKKRRMERERKQRREAIINTAERFFLNRGYEKTNVEEIALKAGYTKVTIYNYFESKDDLFVAVVARTFHKLLQIMENTLKQSDVEYELRSLGDAYLTFVDDYPDDAGLFESGQLSLVITRMIKKEEKEQSLTESEEEFRINQLKIQELMTDVINETMKKSGVQSKVDPFSVIMALSTLGQSIRELVIRGKTGSRPEEKTREYLSVLFNIIDKGLKHYDD